MASSVDFSYCFGCGVCAKACPKDALTIDYDAEGFYKPSVDKNKCINCGICLDVCGFNHDNVAGVLNPTLDSYAAWSKNSDVRKKCSSGGVAFELALEGIRKGFRFVGVRYNAEKKRAEHYIATTEEELESSVGSKYIQSYTVDGFAEIDKKNKYIVVGSPCQIDSLRRYARKKKIEENFILVDFFCHGVPSHFMWEQYCRENEKKVGRIKNVAWRNKLYNWHDSWLMCLDGEKGSVKSAFSKGDLFFRYFLKHYCLGRQCHNDCKYKMFKSSADFRIGDLWGSRYKSNQEGVSGFVVLSKRGQEFLNQCSSIELIQTPFDVVTEQQMNNNARKNPFRGLAIWWLRHGLSMKILFSFCQPFYKVICKIVKHKK